MPHLGGLSGVDVGVLERLVQTIKMMTGSGASVAVPIFRVVGVVKIMRIWGVVLQTLGLNHTDCYFRLNDGTITVPISKVAGAPNMNSFVTGSPIYRPGLATEILAVLNASQCGVIDPLIHNELISTECVVVAKNGVNTFIEYCYSTTDLPTVGQIQFSAEIHTRSSAGGLIAV